VLPTEIEPAQNTPLVEEILDASEVQEAQLLELHELGELEEQIHVIVGAEVQDVVQVERIAQAEAPEHGQNRFSHDILVSEINIAEVQATNIQISQV
jgi:hypothetical protein